MVGCGNDNPQPEVRVIGQAFIGPFQAQIREELAPQSRAVAEARHGERIDLIERRRRFYRIRTAKGAIGWIDGRQLMNADQIAALGDLARQNAAVPAIGQASVYEPLNLHNEPFRSAPSFAQIPEKGVVDVIGYRLVPRTSYVPPPLIEERKPEPKPKKKKKGKKDEKEEKLPPLPAPASPEPPDDWLELSASKPEPEAPGAPNVQQGVRMDDWTLVRMKDGKVGWALSHMLVMAIPDEVAQYSEGHRIMGYWPLGEVTLEDGSRKNHWLWVTQSQKSVPFAFDGFRIFMYAARRNRYEQAYREKNLRGYFPVDVVKPGRKPDYLSEFSIVTEEEGQRVQRTFAFMGYRVTKLAEQPWTAPATSAPSAPAKRPQAETSKSLPWYKRLPALLGK